MSNPYYTPTANPTFRSAGSSETIRNEFSSISAGFDAVHTVAANKVDQQLFSGNSYTSIKNNTSDAFIECYQELGGTSSLRVTPNNIVLTAFAGVEVIGGLSIDGSDVESQLNARAPIASPTFTGLPSAPSIKIGGVASNDPNTLDFYEEGSFTPALLGGTGLIYSLQVGRYTRVGNRIDFTLQIAISSKGTSSGNVLIDLASMPLFANVTGLQPVFNTYISQTSGGIDVKAFGTPGQRSLSLDRVSTFTPITYADLGATPVFMVSGTYFV